MSAKSVALITGGTKGLGAALSLGFARAGYHVIALYHSDTGAARRLEEIFTQAGLRGRTVQCDLATQNLPSEVWDGVGENDALTLINNAVPPFQPKPFHLWQESELEQQLALAVRASFVCAQSVLRRMVRSGGGTIINVLSEEVLGKPSKGFSGYLVGKYGLLGLTKALAVEYEPRGIRVCAVAPPYMQTPLTDAWAEPLRAALHARNPEPATPESVADFILSIAQGEVPPVPGAVHSFQKELK